MSGRLPCAASTFSAVAGNGSKSGLVRNHLASFVGAAVSLPLVLCSGSWESLGAEDSPPQPATSRIEETNSLEPLRTWLQLQEQLHATQLAIQQSRQEAREAATQTTEALSKGLQTIQQAFSAQQAQDLEAMQRTNKVMLILVGMFAGVGFLTLFVITCFQWRMSKGLAEISAAFPTALELGPGSSATDLALAEPSSLPRAGAVEQPEKRTHELEQSPHPALRRRKGTPIENRLFPAPGDSFRRQQFRALKVAVLVGLISAAVMALLLYVLTSRKLGSG